MLIRKTLAVLFVVLLAAGIAAADFKVVKQTHQDLSLIHISEPTRPPVASRMPSSA